MFITFFRPARAADLLFSLYLIAGAVEDIRERSVSLRYLALGGLMTGLTAAFLLSDGGLTAAEVTGRLAASVPGVILLAAGLIRPGSIGPADGALMAMVGLLAGFRRTVGCLIISFAAAAAFGVIWAACRKKKIRDVAIPFIPFITAGYMVGGWI